MARGKRNQLEQVVNLEGSGDREACYDAPRDLDRIGRAFPFRGQLVSQLSLIQTQEDPLRLWLQDFRYAFRMLNGCLPFP